MRPHIDLFTIYELDLKQRLLAIDITEGTEAFKFFSSDILHDRLAVEDVEGYCFEQSGGHLDGKLYCTNYNYGAFSTLEYADKLGMMKAVRDIYFPHLGDHFLHYLNNDYEEYICYGTVKFANSGVHADVWYDDNFIPEDCTDEGMLFSKEIVENFINRLSSEYDREHDRVCKMYYEEYSYLWEEANSYENVEDFIEVNEILFTDECIPFERVGENKFSMVI